MRLDCPNCGAAYEVAHGMIPPAGRHVQCAACHTRWFVRGAPRSTPSEEQIISRLESRAVRPKLVPVPDAATEASDPAPFRWEDDPGPEVAAAAEPAAEPPKEAEPPPAAAPPAVPQPRPITAPLLEPLAQRPPAPRLDLSPDAAPEVAPRGPSRFGRGLLLALALFLLALATYRFADPIATRAPALAPAVQGFAAAVDGVRENLAERLGGAGG